MTDVVALRRALHRIPELGFDVHRTQAAVRDAIADLGEVRTIARTGLMVDLGPADAPRTLLLRADMDGLPVTEETGLPFASERPGFMHACGHDAHMAALITAARALAVAPPEGVRLRVIFQPAEEGCGGALACIEDGALDGVDAAFGLHVWNELPLGTVAATAGGIMAGVVELGLIVRGRGGHGAIPDRTRDPIVASAHLVTALQTVVSRSVSPLSAAVVTIGSVQAGDAFNVIPDVAHLLGTVRAFDAAEERAIEEEVRRIALGVGTATGTTIEVTWERHTAPTVNDRGIAALAAEAARGVAGIRGVLTDYRTMAGEDFGEILSRVPGCYCLVGSGDPAGGPTEPHHSPRFDIDEGVLDVARGLHLAVVARFAAGESG